MDDITPSNSQILNFLVEPNPIMTLWCRRQTQMYIDHIQNKDNIAIIKDLVFNRITPKICKINNWENDDSKIIDLLPMAVSGPMNRRTKKQIAKLIRMIYFIDFFNKNGPYNGDDVVVNTFKSVFIINDESMMTDFKRRHTI